MISIFLRDLCTEQFTYLTVYWMALGWYTWTWSSYTALQSVLYTSMFEVKEIIEFLNFCKQVNFKCWGLGKLKNDDAARIKTFDLAWTRSKEYFNRKVLFFTYLNEFDKSIFFTFLNEFDIKKNYKPWILFSGRLQLAI